MRGYRAMAATVMTSLPLAGRTVRCASDAPAAQMAAFLLSDLGAEVSQAPPGGPAEIGGLGSPAGAVRVSPYGERGRFAGGPPHHSAVEAVAGAQMAQYTYSPGPAYLVSPYSTVAQALLAAISAVAAMLVPVAVARTVSALQGLLAINEGFYVFGPEHEADRFMHSPRGQTPTYSTYRAADEWIFIGASTTTFMIKVLQALGLDEILDDPRLHGGAHALRASDIGRELWQRIEPIIRANKRDHWLELFEQIKVPAGPVLTMEEALAHPQIKVAGLAEAGEPIGRLTQLTQVSRHGDATPRTPQPAGRLPLSGLRVVELAGYIAGSYTGRLLADLGATVVKIEPPDGDPFRSNGYGFVAWNRGKRSIALNLRDSADRARLFALVAEADILVTNYRPEALTRMGVGREELFGVNPGLIHCTLSAFGESGPLAHLPGFDPVVQAFAGIMKRQGGDGEPVKPQMAATDYLSAMLATLGILAARADQVQRGGGFVVRTSLLAAALLLNADAYDDVRAGRPYTRGGRDFKGPRPLDGLHAARDGWLLTAAEEREDARPEAMRYLESGLAGDPVEAAIAALSRFGVPSVPAIDPWKLTEEPHLADNRLWITIEQPGLGALTMPASVLGSGQVTAAPDCGQDNDVAAVWEGVAR
jgi:crotonobetainyl-CoA:carnitine CoA-transferase CaiB-like acyl-CoA transferase